MMTRLKAAGLSPVEAGLLLVHLELGNVRSSQRRHATSTSPYCCRTEPFNSYRLECREYFGLDSGGRNEHMKQMNCTVFDGSDSLFCCLPCSISVSKPVEPETRRRSKLRMCVRLQSNSLRGMAGTVHLVDGVLEPLLSRLPIKVSNTSIHFHLHADT